MVLFYKHDIAGWRGGTVMLSDRAYRVYHVIVEEIMLHEGPVPLHERSLAGKANRSVRDFNAAIGELVAAGKLSIRDGFIDNSRCGNELRTIRDHRESAANGGRKSGEIRRVASEINDLERTPLQQEGEHKRGRVRVRVREERDISVPSEPRPKRVRTMRHYPDDFEVFWTGYPTDANMSKAETLPVWEKLPAEDRAKAVASLPAFRAYCTAHPDYRPIHAVRYLSKARYDGFAEVRERIETRSVYIVQGDPRWAAWEAHYRRTKGTAPPTDANRGWHFPSEYPPEEKAA